MEVDLPPHPVIGHMLQVGDAEEFLEALDLESLDLFLSQQAETVSHSHRGGLRQRETCTA